MPKPTQVLTLPSPAFLGLNKERQQVPQDPSWCIEAQNAVIDGAGRLAARKGRDTLTTVAVGSGAAIKQVFEYLQTNGTSIIISTQATKLYDGTTVLTDRTGALTPTAGNWQFVNFNGNCYAWQASHSPIVKTGAGNWAALVATSGSVPAGNAAVAAFGRIWALSSDKQIIKYCALLDATKWDAVDGAGQIDMRSVWTHGMDEVVAITAYAAGLIVLGKRHIVIWVDGSGSELGLDPTTMYVGQTIEGVGCIARDSIQLIGELDVFFWSDSGVRSLQRTIQEKATPINEITHNIRDFLAAVRDIANTDNVRSVYAPDNGMYLLIVPDADITIYADTKQRLEDGSCKVTEWPGFDPSASCQTIAGVTHFGGAGVVERYFGFDDNGALYRFAYRMPWNSLGGDQLLKLLKEFGAVVMAPDDTPIVFKWYTDFKSNAHTVNKTVTGGAFAEYNADALYSVAEYSGDITVKDLRVWAESGSEFKFVSVGVEVDISGFPFAIQSVSIVARSGRSA